MTLSTREKPQSIYKKGGRGFEQVTTMKQIQASSQTLGPPDYESAPPNIRPSQEI